MTVPMKVNIVLLVSDRPRLTQQSIISLVSNTPKDLYNLTVIDDGNQRFPIEQYLDATTLKIYKSKHITGQARNLGVYWAEKYWGRGDYLYLSDNDVFFTPGWLPKLIDALEWGHSHLNVQLIGGWNHLFLQPKDNLQWTGTQNSNVALSMHDAITGASQLMHWNTWDKYSPLDAHAVGVGQSEDYAFCQKIIKDGGKVASIYPRVVLNCGITNTFKQPSPGADLMLQELIAAKRQYPYLIWE